MKASTTLKNDIAAAYPHIHAARLHTLFTFVESGMTDQRLTVTYLGRGLKSTSDTDKKHDIKRADRLIGNPHLHSERICFYEMMTEYLVGNHSHPIVIVDWSPVNGQEIFQVLRASIPMGGRTLTLYEKVYPESELNSEQAHQDLLDNLALCLPSDCRPILLSDAIFRAPWFKAIEQKGWFWVGRIRGLVYLSRDGKQWSRSKAWFEKASSRAKKLGKVYYGKKQKFPCKAVIYQSKNKSRIVKKMRGGKSQCSTSKYQEQKAREPWLLAYHLPEDETFNAHKVVKLYAQRMQIEEGFRDTKNGHLGLGLEKANSKSAERFDNLLLIASLILFLLWCVGFASVQLTQSRLLQANTEKRKRVLSYIYVGREVIDDVRYCPDEPLIIYALSQLSMLTIQMERL